MAHLPLSVTVLVTILCTAVLQSATANARKWNNTGVGAIVFEEAWSIPEILNMFNISKAVPPTGVSTAQLTANLFDIHNQRLEAMDANGIDFMVLSCWSPCIQGISDPDFAQEMSIMANNELARQISNNTLRFGAFAALNMHNATLAAQELNRTVKDLGFLGALINDYQVSGSDNATLLYYDQPEYDVFWQMVEDLNVPVYMHPRNNIPQIFSLVFQHAPWLSGPVQEYATTLSSHVLGLCTNGVFDRFPKVQIVIGHLGERIASDLWRIDVHLHRQQLLNNGIQMKRNVASYLRTNIYETASGNFATDLLEYHITKVGLDRLLYSIDYPFITIEEGSKWVESLSVNGVLNHRDFLAFKRETAIRLLRLDE